MRQRYRKACTTTMNSYQETLLLPGERLVGERTFVYHIIGLLGKGGQGEVYRANNLLNEATPVALKISTNPKRLEQEAFLCRSLHHDALIPRVLAHGDFACGNSSMGYLATEYIPGCTLDNYCVPFPHRVLPVQRAMWIGLQLCDILACLHKQGVVHRDIKPTNILVMTKMDIRLIDFGSAAHIGTRSNGDGTAGYIAPEETFGHYSTPATDVYSLGATLQAVLTTGSIWDAVVGGWRWTDLGHLIREMLCEKPTHRPPLNEIGDRLAECYQRNVQENPSSWI